MKFYDIEPIFQGVSYVISNEISKCHISAKKRFQPNRLRTNIVPTLNNTMLLELSKNLSIPRRWEFFPKRLILGLKSISNEISKCHISAKTRSKLEIDFTFTMKPYMNFHLALFLKKFPRLECSSHWTFKSNPVTT